MPNKLKRQWTYLRQVCQGNIVYNNDTWELSDDAHEQLEDGLYEIMELIDKVYKPHLEK